jgi:hypothetical protein
MDISEFIKQKHYVAFVDKYSTPTGLGLDGESCYRLRGGLVHRGNAAGHAYWGQTHVIFTVPESANAMHAFSMVVGDKSTAVFDLVSFCDAMILAARIWYEEYQDHPKVIANMPNLLRWRPTGVPPFIDGMPVVASGP